MLRAKHIPWLLFFNVFFIAYLVVFYMSDYIERQRQKYPHTLPIVRKNPTYRSELEAAIKEQHRKEMEAYYKMIEDRVHASTYRGYRSAPPQN